MARLYVWFHPVRNNSFHGLSVAAGKDEPCVPVQYVASVVFRAEGHGGVIQAFVIFTVHGALVETSCLFFVIAIVGVVASRAVQCLYFWQIGGQVGGYLRCEIHRQFAAFSTLAGDNHCAVCGFRTIKCRSRSAFQHAYTFNIFRIDIHQTVGAYLSVVAELGKVGAFTCSAVTDGHAVQNNKRLVVSCDGGQSAYVDRYRAG